MFRTLARLGAWVRAIAARPLSTDEIPAIWIAACVAAPAATPKSASAQGP
jgi:hypothetical protein